MRQPALDLRASRAVLRRRWIWIALLVVLGVCGGLCYAIADRPEPRAAVQVQLPDRTLSGADLITTDTKTLESVATYSGVLTPAAASVTPPIAVDQLERLVSATIQGDNILRIEVRAASANQAVGLATAVAGQYRKYVAHSLVDGPTKQLGSATIIPPPSRTARIGEFALIGLLAGLLLGAVAFLAQSRQAHRLRRRDEIADAMGVPVLASMNAEVHKDVADWISLLERFEPSALNALILRRVLRHVVPADFAGPFTVHVMSLAGDKPAVATGPELALFAAKSGIRTRLAPTENLALEPLIAACAALRTSNHAGHQLLTLGTEREERKGPLGRPMRWDDDPALVEPQLVISVLAVDPSHPELPSVSGPAILALSSGFAFAGDLARVTQASAAAGLEIEGIVVVNPDASDSTTGLLPGRRMSGWRARNDKRGPGQGHRPAARDERHGRHRPPGSRAVSWDAGRTRGDWPTPPAHKMPGPP
jgi:capsular polysaccharide biosynthesis protein